MGRFFFSNNLKLIIHKLILPLVEKVGFQPKLEPGSFSNYVDIGEVGVVGVRDAILKILGMNLILTDITVSTSVKNDNDRYKYLCRKRRPFDNTEEVLDFFMSSIENKMNYYTDNEMVIIRIVVNYLAPSIFVNKIDR